MLSLTQGLGAKVALRALGMPKDGIEPAADLVVSNAYWNPRPLERDVIRDLIARAWSGDPPGFAGSFGRFASIDSQTAHLSTPVPKLRNRLWIVSAVVPLGKRSGSAYGTRTRAPALRGPCPNRLDERAK